MIPSQLFFKRPYKYKIKKNTCNNFFARFEYKKQDLRSESTAFNVVCLDSPRLLKLIRRQSCLRAFLQMYPMQYEECTLQEKL